MWLAGKDRGGLASHMTYSGPWLSENHRLVLSMKINKEGTEIVIFLFGTSFRMQGKFSLIVFGLLDLS